MRSTSNGGSSELVPPPVNADSSPRTRQLSHNGSSRALNGATLSPVVSPVASPPLSPSVSPAYANLSLNGRLRHSPTSKRSVTVMQELSSSDLDIINAMLDKYSKLLTKFATQTWKGHERWQLLANDLQQKIIQQQDKINNDEIHDDKRIAAMRQLMQEFNKAVHHRLDYNAKELQENYWVDVLPGVNQISLASILSNFKEHDAKTINIILMKFEKGFIDYDMVTELSTANNLIKGIKAKYVYNKNVAAFAEEYHLNGLGLMSSFIAKFVKKYPKAFQDPQSNLNPADATIIDKMIKCHIKITASEDNEIVFEKSYQVNNIELIPRLVEDISKQYPGALIEVKEELKDVKEMIRRLKFHYPDDKHLAMLEVEFRLINTTELLEQLKKKYPESNALDAFEQEFQILYQEFLAYAPPFVGLWLPRAIEMCRLLSMAVRVTPIDSSEFALTNELFVKLFKINWSGHLSIEIPLDSDQKYFKKLEAHLLVLQKLITIFCIHKPNAPQLKNYLRNLYEAATNAVEQGYIVQENKAEREEVTAYLKCAKLLAIYEFCYYFTLKKTPFVETKLDLISIDLKKELDQIDALTKMLDPEGVVYNEFLDNREFKNISLITAQQLKLLKEFREQFWQGDAVWQNSAKKLTEELEKFQKIVDNKYDKLLHRLAATSEIIDIFDTHIHLRVGNDLDLLKQQRGWFTQKLQTIDMGYYLSRISIRDIFADYRENGLPAIYQSYKNIIRRLTPENRRSYVYQANFRSIYYQIGLYASEYLHEFLKPKLDSDLVKIARQLMNSLTARSKKLKEIHKPEVDLALCIKEAEGVVQDFNNAILAYMNVHYTNELAPHRQLAEEHQSGPVRTLMLRGIDEVHHTVVYGEAKQNLVDAIRTAIKSINPPQDRPELFSQAVFSQIRKKNLDEVLSWAEDNINSDLNSKKTRFAEKLTHIVDGMAATLTGQETLAQINSWQQNQIEGSTRLIAIWVKFYYGNPIPKVGAPEVTENEKLKREKKLNSLIGILSVEIKRTIFNLCKRAKALATIEVAIAKFTSSSAKERLMETAFGLIDWIDDAEQRKKVGEALSQASTLYGLSNDEPNQLWRFMIDRQEETPDLTELDGILLAFKRNDEKILKSWIDEIKSEYQAEQQQRLEMKQEERNVVASGLAIPDHKSLASLNSLFSPSTSMHSAILLPSVTPLVSRSLLGERSSSEVKPLNTVSILELLPQQKANGFHLKLGTENGPVPSTKSPDSYPLKRKGTEEGTEHELVLKSPLTSPRHQPTRFTDFNHNNGHVPPAEDVRMSPFLLPQSHA
ncbi:MAG: hypothetical protein V4501_05385 [Pseudomonadota bacterium]